MTVPPLAAPTMVASAVEMKSALPRPHPARNPMIVSTLPLSAAAKAKTTMSASPIMSVRLAPMRLEIQLVNEHREAGDEQVAGEQHLGLGGRRLQVVGDGRQDRVDEPDAHERDDAGERDRPDLLGLLEDAGGAVVRVRAGH